MPVVGLLGGVASGKSLVADEFRGLGAGLLDADRVGHEVLAQAKVVELARQRWGEEIFDPQGRIDRGRLAKVVFARTPAGLRELKYLEEITHPRIGRLLEIEAARLAAIGCPLAVLDAAVMLKAGWNRFCDRILFVDAPREVRLARALNRGWSEEEFTAREAAQGPLEKKRELADVVLDNSGSVDQTRAQVVRIWQSLVG